LVGIKTNESGLRLSRYKDMMLSESYLNVLHDVLFRYCSSDFHPPSIGLGEVNQSRSTLTICGMMWRTQMQKQTKAGGQKNLFITNKRRGEARNTSNLNWRKINQNAD